MRDRDAEAERAGRGIDERDDEARLVHPSARVARADLHGGSRLAALIAEAEEAVDVLAAAREGFGAHAETPRRGRAQCGVGGRVEADRERIARIERRRRVVSVGGLKGGDPRRAPPAEVAAEPPVRGVGASRAAREATRRGHVDRGGGDRPARARAAARGVEYRHGEALVMCGRAGIDARTAAALVPLALVVSAEHVREAEARVHPALVARIAAVAAASVGRHVQV